MLYFIIFAFLISASQAKVEKLEPGQSYSYNMHKEGDYCLSVNVTGEENGVYILIKVNGITLFGNNYHSFRHCFHLNEQDFGTIEIKNNYILTPVYIQEDLLYVDTKLEKEREEQNVKFFNIIVILTGCLIIFSILCIICCFFYCMKGCCTELWGCCTELLKLITRKNNKPAEKEIELDVLEV